MKRVLILIVLLGFLSASSFAQDRLAYCKQKFPIELYQQTEFLKELFPQLQSEPFRLQLKYFKQSKYSKHYTFNILFRDLPIFTNFIKVNTDQTNNIVSIANGLGNYELLSEVAVSWERNLWQTYKPTGSHWTNKELIKNTYYALFEKDNTTQVVQVQEAWDKTYDKTKLINLANKVVGEWNHERRLKVDTIVNLNVFLPDPLTFLSQTYGTPYLDLNDQDQPWLAPAYIAETLRGTYDTSTNLFLLENKYIKLSDFQSPANVVPFGGTTDFYFNRSEDGFEDGMVAYHITKMHDHLTSLGYDSLMDVQLEADAHGQFGGDNSVFNRNGGAPTIIFGDGGVDDAEDADVIIHEYSHGISWSANNNTFFGNERPALDEGLADYFATSYSRSFSNFGWENMFSWDGHNEYWGGRTATTMADYSVPFSGNLYDLGEVWNAAMQKIFTDLGREKTDELMLETLLYLTDSSTLPNAAQYMLQADTLLNNGENTALLCAHFSSKKILEPCETIVDTMDEIKEFKVYNSRGFSEGSAPVIFSLGMDRAGILQLFDMNGRLIRHEKIVNGRIELNPNDFACGLYIVKISSANELHTVKLSRF